MSAEIAASILAGLIFGMAVYAAHIKVKTGDWPKLRSPFE
jgi:hypothetical protein